MRSEHEQQSQHDPFIEATKDGLIRFGLFVALALFLSSGAPQGLAMATFSSLLFMCATASGVIAAFTRTPLFSAPSFSRWDEAAGYLALSLATGLMVDEDRVRAIVQSMQ